MSYNLLIDTGFNNTKKHWKLTNCVYEDGYFCGNSKVFSIEQDIILPTKTKVYFSVDCISFDKNIKQVFVGVQTQGVLESTIKKPKIGKRTRLSVVDEPKCERITVKVIIESENNFAKLYIDSPMLIDLVDNGKKLWSRPVLDKLLYYRYGFDYANEYRESEFTLSNPDINSTDIKAVQGISGVVFSIIGKHTTQLTFNGIVGHTYVAKLDYFCATDYGKIKLNYNQTESEILDSTQQYIIFTYDSNNQLTINFDNEEVLPYIINLRHLLIIDTANKNIEIDDIAHMPYVS